MILFSLVSLAFASDSLNERVRSVLAAKISNRVERLAASNDSPRVKVISTGLSKQLEEHLTVGPKCQKPFNVDVSFSKREDFQGLIKAHLKVSNKNGLCGNYLLYPTAEIWMQLPTATKSILAGEAVEMRYDWRRYDEVHGAYLSDKSGVWSARSNIAKGQVITLDKVRKMPTNRDGDQVELRVKSGSLSIKSNGKLMRDAYLGDQVKVLSFATSSVVRGTLTKKGIVEIGAGK